MREVKKVCRIPVSVKLSPFYTSLAHFALSLEEVGADGMVLFNRFFEPDIDIEELEILLELELSRSRDLLLRLRWLGILSGSLKTATLAVTGGVHTAVDATGISRPRARRWPSGWRRRSTSRSSPCAGA